MRAALPPIPPVSSGQRVQVPLALTRPRILPDPCSLFTEHLSLTQWSATDGPALVQAVHRLAPYAERWLPWCKKTYSETDASGWIWAMQTLWLDDRGCAFSIRDRHTHALMGGIALHQLAIAPRRAEVGYWVAWDHQRKGVAREAIEGLCMFAWDILHLKRLEFLIALDNEASLRCALSAGARIEGVARNRLAYNQELRDARVLGMVPPVSR